MNDNIWKTKIPSRFIDFSARVQPNSEYCIGVKRLSTGGGTGTWILVNENGDAVDTTSTYFANHPIYKELDKEYVLGENTFINVPKFYVRSNGEDSFWISNVEKPGFVVHPAFKRVTRELNNFYIGKYTCSSNYSSKENELPVVGETFSKMKSMCESKNAGGIGGYHMMSIYEYSALQLLFLIEYRSTDCQTLIGTGCISSQNVEVCSSPNVETSNYHGIIGLWGNAWQYVDCIKSTSTGVIKVKSFNDYSLDDEYYYTTNIKMNTKPIKEIYTAGVNCGYYNNLIIDDGENYSTKYLFIPNASTLTNNYYNGSYSDYMYCPVYGNDNYLAVGGSCDSQNMAGLFAKKFISAGDKSLFATTRICKF